MKNKDLIQKLLVQAIEKDDLKLAIKLAIAAIAQGADVNQSDEQGRFPVQLVRSLEILEVLKQQQLDLQVRLENGDTVLHFLVRRVNGCKDPPLTVEEFKKLVVKLLEWGVKINAKNRKGDTVLDVAFDTAQESNIFNEVIPFLQVRGAKYFHEVP